MRFPNYEYVELTPAWQQFFVAFDDLAQEGWGEVEKDFSHVMWAGLELRESSVTDFDFFIDDVAFF